MCLGDNAALVVSGRIDQCLNNQRFAVVIRYSWSSAVPVPIASTNVLKFLIDMHLSELTYIDDRQ